MKPSPVLVFLLLVPFAIFNLTAANLMKRIMTIAYLTLNLLPISLSAQWVQTNGPFGGIVHKLVATNGGIFAGTDGAGAFLSTNNGTNWIRTSDGLTNTDVSSFAALSTDVFAGTRDGMFRSTDNGTIWTPVNSGLTDTYIRSLESNNGNLFAGTFNSGVFISTNNGGTWSPTGPVNAAVEAFVATGGNLFAGTQNFGVFLSTNNGTSWTQVNGGLTSAVVYALAVNGTNIFVGTPVGVFLSTNNGTNWTPVNSGLTQPFVRCLAFSGNSLFAGTGGGGVFISTNNGTSWTETALTNEDIGTLAVTDGGLLAGTYLWGEGIFRSTDLGSTWTVVNSGLTNTYVRDLISMSDQSFAAVYGGGVFRSTNDGEDWLKADSGLGPFVYSLGANGNYLFAGTLYGVFRSGDNGATWQPVGTDRLVQAFVVSGENLLAGTDNSGVFVSTDDGVSWLPANEGLPCSDVRALTAVGSSVLAGTNTSYPDPDSCSGGVYLSTNDGAIWSHTGLDGEIVEALAVADDRLFAGTHWNGVYVSTDSGSSWTWSGPTYSWVNSIVVNGNNLFAGIWGEGVFRSTNNGLEWESVNTGLRDTLVTTVSVNNTDLLVGTSNGGAWRRPLSELVSVNENDPGIPEQSSLSQNYPNPFNPKTDIGFQISPARRSGGDYGFVCLRIYDLLGREVATLVNEKLAPGTYTRQWDATGFSSGVYFYRLSVMPATRRDLVPQEGDGQAEGFVQTRKLLLLR